MQVLLGRIDLDQKRLKRVIRPFLDNAMIEEEKIVQSLRQGEITEEEAEVLRADLLESFRKAIFAKSTKSG
ncbi:MAG: hypothetical protein AAB583_00905, partial [Patescibacteria group bacterium]